MFYLEIIWSILLFDVGRKSDNGLVSHRLPISEEKENINALFIQVLRSSHKSP